LAEDNNLDKLLQLLDFFEIDPFLLATEDKLADHAELSLLLQFSCRQQA